MLSKADEEQLQRICGNDETLSTARKLVPIAKARTKQGSGHYLAQLATGLPAICAYLASKQLNNNDIEYDNARHASCLKPNDFKKALQTVTAVLESELSTRKGKREVTYDTLHEKYSVPLSFASFNGFLRQAEHALVQMDVRHKIDSLEVRCAIFFWLSSNMNVKELPSLDEFAQDNSVLPKRLTPTIKALSNKCNTLKAKLIEAAMNASRPSSPAKSLFQPSTPRTPRRSPTKPLRELPTRDSVKRQRQAQITDPGPSQTTSNAEAADVNMGSSETPTKKRKLDTPSVTSSSPKRVSFPPVTPSTSRITYLTSSTKTKPNPTPAVPSPLRRSARFILQQEVDADIEVDDDDEIPTDINRSLGIDLANVGGDDEELSEEEHLKTRRFRPVYQDYKQWFARDVRVLRMWKEASESRGCAVIV